jgi:hypothetical protein
MSEWRNFLIYSSLDKATWEFKASTNLTPPMLLYYSGVLPATPDIHHLLLVTQLNVTATGSLIGKHMPYPHRASSHATHDFSLIYEVTGKPDSRDFLFHFQINSTDITAKQLTYTLVEVLMNTHHSCRQYLREHKFNGFWSGIATNKLYQLKVDTKIWIDRQSLQEK